MKKCEECKQETKYDHEYDAFFCSNCKEWTERACSDPRCEFCSVRPEKPPIEKDDTNK